MTAEALTITVCLWSFFLIFLTLIVRAIFLGYENIEDIFKLHGKKYYETLTEQKITELSGQKPTKYIKSQDGFWTRLRLSMFGYNSIPQHRYIYPDPRDIVYYRAREGGATIKALRVGKFREFFILESEEFDRLPDMLRLMSNRHGFLLARPDEVREVSLMSNNEIIKVKTEDGTEIEARVLSRTPPQSATMEGQAVVIRSTGEFDVVERMGDSDNVFLQREGNYYQTKDVRPLTEEEIKLFHQYDPYELKLRDKFATAIVASCCNGKGFDQFELISREAYYLAELMLQSRQIIQTENPENPEC